MNTAGRSRRSTTDRKGGAPPASSPPAAVLDGGTPQFVARLVPLEAGVYAFSLAAETGWREPVAGLALPAVQVCPVPDHDGLAGAGAEGATAQGAARGAIEITDSFGHAGSWLGGRHRVLFVKSPAGGGAALVTGYLARDPDSTALELDIRRLDPPVRIIAEGTDEKHKSGDSGAFGHTTTSPLPPLLTLRMGGPAAAERSPQPVRLDVVAHIRGRGDVRFQDTPWVGRLGTGLWIEAFMVFPRHRSAAAAIEYKGLTAGGAETPWIGGGSLCGSRGQGAPLIGFAVRQKAVPGGQPVDCEYIGYFQSGATAGPARNGAPCRSTIDNDPLEGMQLRITPRPATPNSPRAASAKTK